MAGFDRIFFDLNAGLAALTLATHGKRYFSLKSGAAIPTAKVSDAMEFVQHTSLSLWWMLGVLIVPILEIHSAWLILWVLCGLAGVVLMERLVAVSGLSTFLQAGEASVQTLIEERTKMFTDYLAGQEGITPDDLNRKV